MTKRFGMSRKDYSGSVLKLLSLLFPILLISGAGCGPPPPIPPEFSEAIGVIAKERTRAEHWGSTLKRNYAKDTKEYKKGEALYVEAQAAFDGWIEQIKFDLRAGNDIEKSDQYKKSLKEAAEKSQIFINYVEVLTTKGGELIPLVLNALINAGREIYDEYRREKERRREEIIKNLDQLKWKSFDEIKGR